MSRVLQLAALLVAGLGDTLHSQNVKLWRDSAAKLQLAVRALQDSMQTGDSTVVLVTEQSGVVLRASRDLLPDARVTLDRFLVLKRKWFGTAEPSTGGFRILLRDFGGYGGPGSRLPATLELAGLPDSNEASRVSQGVSRQVISNPDSASRTVLFEFGKLMRGRASVRLKLWLLESFPLHLEDQDRKLAAMYGFVTGAGSAQRNCINGDLADCAYVLGLRATKRPDAGGGYPEFLRADLLLTALETGGENAWERLERAGESSLAEQLSMAAGVSLDSLLARWRGGLLALRPTSRLLTEKQAIVAALWALTLMAGAIGVSRWA